MTAPNSARGRVSIQSMLSSSSLPAWRERLERSEGARSARSNGAAGNSGNGGGSGSYSHATAPGPALTLEQMRTPAKEGMQSPPAAAATQPRRTQYAYGHAHDQQGPAYADAEGGAYQYDLYPSSSWSRHPDPNPNSSRRSDASGNEHQAASLFYPPDAASSLSHSLSATRLASSMSASRAHHAHIYASPTPGAGQASPALSLDIPATQKRIRTLMDEQNQRSVHALAASSQATMQRQHEQAQMQVQAEQQRRATAAPSYPHTNAATVARGARSVAEMKRDVAFQLMDRSHPSNPLNHPRDVTQASVATQPAGGSAGSFHLAQHSRHALAEAPPPPNARLGAGYTHPLQGDAHGGDRRARSILSTAHTASMPLTQAQLRANAVPRQGGPAGAVVEEKESMQPPRPLSFFPVDSPAEPSSHQQQQAAQRQPAKSAYLATMHAGALRVEHVLRQPKVQVMLDALLPVTLSREAIAAEEPVPPSRGDPGANVDRLLYDTITGREERRAGLASGWPDAERGRMDAGAPYVAPAVPGATIRSSSPAASSASSTSSYSGRAPLPLPLSPPSTSFSRASLLHREARLDALLALSSPGAGEHEAPLRMSYDPDAAAAAQAQAEAAAAADSNMYFDTRGVLGDSTSLHSATQTRTALVDVPRSSGLVPPPHVTSNVEVVLEELLGPSSASASATALAPSPIFEHRYRGEEDDAAEETLERTRIAPSSAAAAAASPSPDLGSSFSRFDDGVGGGLASPLAESFEHERAYQASMQHYSPTAAESHQRAIDDYDYDGNDGGGGGSAISITQEQLEYLQASTSVAGSLDRAEVADAYAASLSAKAESHCFVRERHEVRSLFLHWRTRFLAARERDRVLRLSRHKGDAGYEHFRAQQRRPIEEIKLRQRQAREERDREEEEAATAGGEVARSSSAPPSTSSSALLSDAPSRPACVSNASLQRKTFILESSHGGSNEMVATIHADQSRSRRVFVRWARWARVERLGRRKAEEARVEQKRTWFKNWRDLMRIVRGEFHFWAAGKQSDAAEAAALTAQRVREEGERAERLRRERRERGMAHAAAGGVEAQELPLDEQPYARASPHPTGRGFRARSPSPSPSPSPSHYLAHSSRAQSMASSSPRSTARPASPSPSSFSFSPSSPARGSGAHAGHTYSALSSSPTAPLAAHLESASTREHFSTHQEAIYRARREEEELRHHFAMLREKHAGAGAGTLAGAGAGAGGAVSSSPSSRSGVVGGPLLFELGSSIQRPSFVVDAHPKPVQHAGSQHRYAPSGRSRSPSPSPSSSPSSDSMEPVHVSLEPFRLTSPIRTATGATLHQVTGSPALDANLVREGERAEVAPRKGSGAAAAAGPLRVPEFLTRRKGDRRASSTSPPRRSGRDPRSDGADEAMSPVRAHVVPNTASFHASPSRSGSSASSSPRASPSATTHGYLPLDLAPAPTPSSSATAGASAAYYESSHWAPPPPSSVSNEELMANVRIAAEMRAKQAQLKEQNQVAQWKRVELEKQHYRNRVQEQHKQAQSS